MQLTTDRIVKVEERDGVHVVCFISGQIRDETEIHRALEEIGQYIDKNEKSKILVDLENLEYLSSAGLGNLVGLLKKSRKTNGVFKLCSLQDSIKELFQVMRLDKIFEIHDSQDTALAAF